MNDMKWALQHVIRAGVEPTHGQVIVLRSFHSGKSFKIVATVTESTGESESGTGVPFEMFLRDFRIRQSAVDIDTGKALDVMPQELDTIELLNDDGTIGNVYRVLDDGADRAVEPGDHQNMTWLIHTKDVAAPEQTAVMHGTDTGVAFGTDDPQGVAHGSASS